MFYIFVPAISSVCFMSSIFSHRSEVYRRLESTGRDVRSASVARESVEQECVANYLDSAAQIFRRRVVLCVHWVRCFLDCFNKTRWRPSGRPTSLQRAAEQTPARRQHAGSSNSSSRVLPRRSGVTRRGDVRQLPQGAKRQGALGALLVDGLFALHYRIQPNF